MQRITAVGSLLVLLFLPACLISRVTVWDRINARSWQLILIEGEPPLQGAVITLALKDPNQLFGQSGVNRYFGSYRQVGKTGFRAAQIAGTRMAGPPELMEQESRYQELLGRADEVRLVKGEDGQVLELLEGDRTLLAFKPRE